MAIKIRNCSCGRQPTIKIGKFEYAFKVYKIECIPCGKKEYGKERRIAINNWNNMFIQKDERRDV